MDAGDGAVSGSLEMDHGVHLKAELPPRGTGSGRRVGLARALAVVADAVQLMLMPVFVPGILSPADDVLDLAIGLVMVRLLGWHWAFLPTFVAELVPGLDLFPTWTATVWFVTRGGAVRPQG